MKWSYIFKVVDEGDAFYLLLCINIKNKSRIGKSKNTIGEQMKSWILLKCINKMRIDCYFLKGLKCSLYFKSLNLFILRGDLLMQSWIILT